MDLTFVYQKKRSEFGRQCMFNDRGPDLIDNYVSHRHNLHDYILRDPVESGIQNAVKQAEHELNTHRAEYHNGIMNHIEGGWPKEVNTLDEEQTKRYKRKSEKDDNYAVIMNQLIKQMEECILQNNAINIYQQYYTDVDPAPMIEESSARTVNVFQDQCNVKRPITHISWSPDGGSKMAITHCDMKYQVFVPAYTSQSFVWEMENPNTPKHVLVPPTQSACIEYHQKDYNMLASGQMNGQVAVWDLRHGVEPVAYSMMETTHRDPVHYVLWNHSKTGTEFFSGSTDGTVKWWDTRKMSEPLETLILDMVPNPTDQQMSRAMGCSVMEYEPTIPTRFMIGTETGTVISGNKKGKLPLEKMVARYSAHLGPVLALQRNAAFVKNFLTVGDWTARIWSEDCRESAIMWTCYHNCRLSDGGWSPTRFSVFFTCRSDGILDVWDILQNQQYPTIGVKICDEPLTTMRSHESGRLNCVANTKGTAFILELSENLTYSNKNDKALLTVMFERENRREKILEARNREIRLKTKVVGKSSSTVLKKDAWKVCSEDMLTDDIVLAAQQDFYEHIERETKPPETESAPLTTPSNYVIKEDDNDTPEKK